MEWGTGGSTFEAIRANVKVVSVENHVQYCECVSLLPISALFCCCTPISVDSFCFFDTGLYMLRDPEIGCAICRRQLLYICPPVAPTVKFGVPNIPKDFIRKTEYGPKIIKSSIVKDYANYVLVKSFMHGFEPRSEFGTVLIDGRFRVACVLRAAAHRSHEQSSPLVHYFERKAYNLPLSETRFGFTKLERCDRLVLLKPPTNASASLRGAYSEFLGYYS